MRSEYREAIRDQRVIRIVGEINDKRVEEYHKAVDELLKRKETHGKKVFCLISSAGGEVDNSFLLYEELLTLDGIVELYTLTEGIIRSAAFHPFLAAPRDRRLASAQARFYLHEAITNINLNLSGNPDEHQRGLNEHRERIENLKTATDSSIEVVSERTGRNPDEIRELMKQVHSFGVTRALELGIIGHILE